MNQLHERWANANNLTKIEIKELQNDLIKAGFISQEEIDTKWECIQK